MINQISIKTDSCGQFVDVFETADIMRITNYSYLKQEIIIKEVDDKKELEFDRDKVRFKVGKINEFRKCADLFIEATLGILNSAGNEYSLENWDCIYDEETCQWMDIKVISERNWKVYYLITKDEKEVLINQLIFDMLYDFYLSQSPKMTIGNYVNNLVTYHNIEGEKISLKETRRKTIQNGMREYYKKLSTAEIKEQLKMLGVDAELYPQYYLYGGKRNVEKSKFVWDLLYYNKYMITSRQYRRQFTKENRNYPYWEIYDDLKKYKNFLEKVLPSECDYGEEYMNKAMDYFTLESYKRIDFMFKLAIDIPQLEVEDIEFLIKRFHPEVMIPFNDNGNIRYDKKNKYYKPLFMIEDLLVKELASGCDSSVVGQKLFKYQVIRAKAYELMKYHVEIEELDYDEVEKFLRKSYNLYDYHKTNTIWNDIDDVAYKEKDKEQQKQITKTIKRVMDINKLLFK